MTNNFRSRYEQVKALHEADLSVVEDCLGKCSVNFTEETNKNDNRENSCLRQCFIKYFDATLLIDKEMRHYVHGNPIA